MKFVVLFVCAFVVYTHAAISQEFKDKFMEKLQEIGEKCTEQTGASADDISELMVHKKPSTHAGKCMIFCFHKYFKIQNEDGSINLEGSIESLAPLKVEDAETYDKMVQVVTKCAATPPDADPCEFGANIIECGVAESKALGLDASVLH